MSFARERYSIFYCVLRYSRIIYPQKLGNVDGYGDYSLCKKTHKNFVEKINLFSEDPEGPGICSLFLTAVSFLLFLATLPFSLCMCVKVITLLLLMMWMRMMWSHKKLNILDATATDLPLLLKLNQRKSSLSTIDWTPFIFDCVF